MRITILNLTEEQISCHYISQIPKVLLYPSLGITTQFTTRHTELTLTPLNTGYLSNEGLEESKIRPEGFLIRTSMAPSALWHIVSVPDECPWRIYLMRITRKHRKLLIFPRRKLSSFLSEMPDTLPLSSLCLPGTHNTMAFYGWPVSQCQEPSTPLSVQLQSGIRVIDIRLAIIDSRLIAYHGIYPQRTPFQDILSTIHTFLTSQSTSQETIIMSIKQEDFAKNSSIEFSRLVHEEIFNGPGGQEMWYLNNRIPTLGEVRGKVGLFSRFGGNGEGWEGGWEGLGIHPLTWPDSERFGFTWQCKDTLVRTHDWYNLPSFLAIPEKVSLATQILLPPPNSPPMRTLSITFLSASSFPLALPPTIAKGFGWPNLGLGVEGVNSRFVHFLLRFLSEGGGTDTFTDAKDVGDGPRIRGWALLDYYTEPEPALVPLLVECNYRGRRGEEGW